MDPVEAFNRMMEAAERASHDTEAWLEALEAAEALQSWIGGGGFVPQFRISADDCLQFLVNEKTAASVYKVLCDHIRQNAERAFGGPLPS